MSVRQRNQTVDLVRGFAILIVVLGHTLSAISGHENSLLFNVIFSIQMPLFMLVSGYVCGYSKPLTTFTAFAKKVGKRSLALLLPWFCWTFLHWLLTNSTDSVIVYFLHIFSHMDSGYWFLFSLWTIDMIVSIAFFVGNLLTRGKRKVVLWCAAVPIILFLFALLALLGNQVGMNWFSIKLSLYYLPFYCLGYFFFTFREKWNQFPLWVKNMIGLLAGLIYAVLITRYTVHLMSESPIDIMVRMIISLCGCLLVFRLFSSFRGDKFLCKPLLFFGTHSLELYVIHGFFLNALSAEGLRLMDWTGSLVCITNYGICLLCSYIIMLLVGKNKLASRILFYR